MTDWANPVRYHVVPLHDVKPFPSRAFADLVAKETDAAIAAIQCELASKSAEIDELLIVMPYGNAVTFTRDEMAAPHTGTVTMAPRDLLDFKHDGWTLRQLLEHNDKKRREEWHLDHAYTPAQRAAISAHWSAELRAKVAAAKERERDQVRIDPQDEP